MKETSTAEECEKSIGSAQVAAMRHTRNELTVLHKKFARKKINLFGFAAQIFGSK